MHDVVALLEDRHDLNLAKGQVGTVVDVWGTDTYEVEFADRDGRTIALTALKSSDLMQLHFDQRAA